MLCGDDAKENEQQDGLQVVGEALSSGRGKGAARKGDGPPNAVSSFGGIDDGKRSSPDRGVRRRSCCRVAQNARHEERCLRSLCR